MMTTEGTIGRCTTCKREVAHNDPLIGAFCGVMVEKTIPPKPGTTEARTVTERCQGIILRHRKEDNASNKD
jgi:hypothetical protein